jgi:hypothetical protein
MKFFNLKCAGKGKLKGKLLGKKRRRLLPPPLV